ncbi:uncharacterized protein V6R79_019108 [Siganus canaliculatus]
MSRRPAFLVQVQHYTEGQRFEQGASACTGGSAGQARTEWRGNAVAVPLFAVRAAAQGDVILRGSGELKCRVTKGRTVQRQAARNRHTVNAMLYRSVQYSARYCPVFHTSSYALALAIMATAERSRNSVSCVDEYSEKQSGAKLAAVMISLSQSSVIGNLTAKFTL